MKKLMLVLVSVLMLAGCNSDNGALVVHQDFILKAADGSDVVLKQGQEYRVYITPYSLFGSDFYANFFSDENNTSSGIVKFDFVGFKMFPLNGDFEVGGGEIRNHDISMQGRSEFVAQGATIYEEYEECETPKQKRIVKNQTREGIRNVYVQILNASTNELLAEFSYSNNYTERTVLSEGECH
ncbi:hypothetical protein QJS83_13420 [Bdellovibrio sp. 22V]|uniref:hypothetical protein n=1 Tax=Bdellovibrio sp. 22V TaxID=3044166 RepID=UPI0025438138|nr:hypothetical protein [Bdellovibrio sp. 22V]WII71463.1 hypothetical protein QJS83_13420 [Bdellovibrio sp. 22V]